MEVRSLLSLYSGLCNSICMACSSWCFRRYTKYREHGKPAMQIASERWGQPCSLSHWNKMQGQIPVNQNRQWYCRISACQVITDRKWNLKLSRNLRLTYLMKNPACSLTAWKTQNGFHLQKSLISQAWGFCFALFSLAGLSNYESRFKPEGVWLQSTFLNHRKVTKSLK